MTEKLTNVFLEFYIDGTWVDYSDYLVDTIEYSYGISESSISSRVSEVGVFKCLLKDLDINLVGREVRFSVEYMNDVYRKFTGRVYFQKRKVTLDKKSYLYLEIHDWVEECVSKTFSIGLQKNKNGEYVIQSVLGDSRPEFYEFDTTVETYNAVFDLSSNTSKALSELSKVCNSDLGYLFLRHSGRNLLRFYNRNHKFSVVNQIPSETGSYIIKDTNDAAITQLVTEDGIPIIADDKFYSVSLQDEAVETEYSLGDRIYTGINFSIMPRKVDNDYVELYILNSPIRLLPGEEKSDIVFRYTDPLQRAKNVAGTDMIIPVATTDYLLNAAEDGSGADLTSYLQVSIQFFSTYAVVTFKNNATISGYITKFNLRGKGVYSYDPISKKIVNNELSERYTENILDFTAPYQSDVSVMNTLVARLYTNYCVEPAEKLQYYKYIPNKNLYLMLVYLYIDVGDVINIQEDGDSHNYVVKFIKVKITKDGFISVEYKLDEVIDLSDPRTRWTLGNTESSILGINTYLGG